MCCAVHAYIFSGARRIRIASRVRTRRKLICCDNRGGGERGEYMQMRPAPLENPSYSHALISLWSGQKVNCAQQQQQQQRR
uniref:Uncharacterized protein n=1 Tax=Trichogramma kaykai TaxID=54128 RepID=A0ABD2WLN0_9HYME